MTRALDQPADGASSSRLPGHWVLASLGKRVLRPGGVELTRCMLDALAIGPADDVVEFAPGLGATARLTLAREPGSYTAVERDETAAECVRGILGGPSRRCVVGRAEATGLDEHAYHVVYGEAMLTMQTQTRREQIVREAHRILRPGGRYGIHEMCLVPDDIAPALVASIENDMTRAIRHRVAPLTVSGWRELLTTCGFAVSNERRAPMHLLEPRRLFADEGFFGAIRFLWNALTHREARTRVKAMRDVFRRHVDHIEAVAFVATAT